MRTRWRSTVLVPIMKSSMVLEEVTLKQNLCNMYLLIWTSKLQYIKIAGRDPSPSPRSLPAAQGSLRPSVDPPSPPAAQDPALVHRRHRPLPGSLVLVRLRHLLAPQRRRNLLGCRHRHLQGRRRPKHERRKRSPRQRSQVTKWLQRNWLLGCKKTCASSWSQRSLRQRNQWIQQRRNSFYPWCANQSKKNWCRTTTARLQNHGRRSVIRGTTKSPSSANNPNKGYPVSRSF